MIARSDEIFASSPGVGHPTHCLTRKDVAFVCGNSQLEYVHGLHADKVEMNVRGQKGDQDQIGEVRARTRDETSGPQLGYRADGGAVALMVELMSRHATWPDDAPLSSYRISGSYKLYAVTNMEDSRRMSRILRDKDKEIARQSGERMVWGSAKKSRGYTPTVATTS